MRETERSWRERSGKFSGRRTASARVDGAVKEWPSAEQPLTVLTDWVDQLDDPNDCRLEFRSA